MITYTQNNTEQTERKLYELNSCVPSHIEVRSWYSFLLRELVRPYQNFLYDKHISGMNWVQGRSAPYAAQQDTKRFYFGGGQYIYSDKVSQFICACNAASKGAIVRRLEQRFERIYVDEIQDLAGYDLNLLELILRSNVKMTLVGDHRQSTFRTNNASKNKAYVGFKIIDKLKEWQRAGLCSLQYELENHRSNQAIADVADAFYPAEPRTKSKNSKMTGHDGVFVLPSSLVEKYVHAFRPQVLRLSKSTDCDGHDAKNFGDSKGLTFDRVLIYPHKLAQKWLASADISHIGGSAAKLYVGVTRARYSVAFVYEGITAVQGIEPFVF